jgi:hypothetical protein
MLDSYLICHELTVEAGFRVVPGSVVVMGHVSGHSGDTFIRRRAMWTWRPQGARAVMIRISDLEEVP